MTESSRDLPRSMLQIGFIGALIAGCFWILRPFLLPILWAATIVVATWPLLLRIRVHLGGRRGAAAAVMILGLILVLVAPLAIASIAIAQNAERIVGWVKSLANVSVPSPPDWLARAPLVGPTLASYWADAVGGGAEGVSARLAPYASTMAAWFVAQAGSVGVMVVQLLVTVFVAGVLYVSGDTIGADVYRFGRRLAGVYADNALRLAAQAVRAVALGVVVTAMIQSALAGAGLALSGVPFAVPLVVAMFILGVAQVGPSPVLIPAIVWLYWKGDAVWATALVVWTLVILGVDNVLRLILIGRGADLPLLLIFAGVIGGLIAFGVIGLFIGPVLLVVGYTLLSDWIAEDDAAMAPPW